MALGKKRTSKSSNKTIVSNDNGKASKSTSINRFRALDENETHK